MHSCTHAQALANKSAVHSANDDFWDVFWDRAGRRPGRLQVLKVPAHLDRIAPDVRARVLALVGPEVVVGSYVADALAQRD
eukprot:3049941-Alexandrium_andersonii.AAC.1